MRANRKWREAGKWPRRLPLTNDPVRFRRFMREIGEVLDTPDFRRWYEENRCEAAPPFDRFWAYVRASLTIDLPGREMCGVIWEATREAFRSFDATRGKPAKLAEGRFLTHWRFVMNNLAKKHLAVRLRMQWIEAVPEEQLADRRIAPTCNVEVRDMVESLSEQERCLVRLYYYGGKNLGEVALSLHRRKEAVVSMHRRIIEKMRSMLDIHASRKISEIGNRDGVPKT